MPAGYSETVGTSFFDFHEQVARRRHVPANSTVKPTQQPSLEPMTVSQLTSRIEQTLTDQFPQTIHVRGEVAKFRPNQTSGHCYFTLKDTGSCIDCVMWKSDYARLRFVPQDGLELVASGKLGVYFSKGCYQFYVTTLKPIGQGALELAFQQMRAKLEAEGLFAAERKKPLPLLPASVILVTSSEAAALHDILKVLRRYPWLRIMLYSVPVQGEGASRRIAAVLAHLNHCADHIAAEVIILARGGGSLEDLWAFNEEVVARAIAASRIPIITGIGHEVDVSIADLVADYHAHTPTEAAQVVVAAWRDAKERIAVVLHRMTRALGGLLQDARHRLRSIERHEAFRRPLHRINNFRQLLDDRQRALALTMIERDHRGRGELADRQQSLAARISHRLRLSSQDVARRAALLGECHPRQRLKSEVGRLDAREDRLTRAVSGHIARRIERLDAIDRQLLALNPQNVLRRGYTLTLRKKDKSLIRTPAALKPGDRLLTQFADGTVESTVEDSRQLPLFE